jgi:four helix bundle protein
MHDYRKLHTYTAAVDLAESAYAIARALPVEERFALSSQLRRASTSIAINIAEGAGRGGDREFVRYLNIAIGSACEVEALVDLVMRLHSVDRTLAMGLQNETRTLIKQVYKLEHRIKSQRDDPA